MDQNGRRRRDRVKKQATKETISDFNLSTGHYYANNSVSSQRNEGVEIDQMANLDDYSNNPIFRRYWNTANTARQWIEKHRKYSCPSTTTDDSNSILLPPPPLPPVFVAKIQRASEEISTSFESIEDHHSSSAFVEVNDDEAIVEEESKMDLSDDVLAFMAQTIRHRIEREKKKAHEQAVQDETVIFVPADRPYAASTFNEFGGDAAAVAEMLRKGASGEMSAAERRRQEMIRLYGQTAAGRIQADETLMQMKFDQEYDKYHPPFWPNIALKL